MRRLGISPDRTRFWICIWSLKTRPTETAIRWPSTIIQTAVALLRHVVPDLRCSEGLPSHAEELPEREVPRDGRLDVDLPIHLY